MVINKDPGAEVKGKGLITSFVFIPKFNNDFYLYVQSGGKAKGKKRKKMTDLSDSDDGDGDSGSDFELSDADADAVVEESDEVS